MFNPEENIKNIKIKSLSREEKNFLWFNIIKNKEKVEKSKLLEFLNYKRYMLGALIALLILGGGGGVVVASNASVPGDTLFGIDTAIEKFRLGLATSEEKKNELKVKFAEERISEAKNIIEKQSSVINREVDLSKSSVTEVEVDVFTNETTVKIEADDRHYGFITDKKTRDEVVDEIMKKYNLSESQIEQVLSFETEDRSSRPDDKDFLNSLNQVSFKSSKQQREFEGSLSDVANLITNSNLSDEEKAKLSMTLAGLVTLLEANPGLEMEIKTKDGYKVEVEDGKIEIKTKGNDLDDNDDDNKGHGNDDDRDDDDNPGINHGNDVREDDSEVFCRGEWRDPEDCEKGNGGNSSDNDDEDSDDDSDNSEDDDSEDNSGSGNDNDDDDDSNDDSEDNDNSGHGNGNDDDN